MATRMEMIWVIHYSGLTSGRCSTDQEALTGVSEDFGAAKAQAMNSDEKAAVAMILFFG